MSYQTYSDIGQLPNSKGTIGKQTLFPFNIIPASILYMHSKSVSFLNWQWVWEIYCCAVLCFTAIVSPQTNSGIGSC